MSDTLAQRLTDLLTTTNTKVGHHRRTLLHPMAFNVVVFGMTEWRTHDYKRLARFRGSQERLVVVRDESGKPARSAHRWIVVRVRCADGVTYRFSHPVTKGGLVDDEACCTMTVHGTPYMLSSYDSGRIPWWVRRAHRLAIRPWIHCLGDLSGLDWLVPIGGRGAK